MSVATAEAMDRSGGETLDKPEKSAVRRREKERFHIAMSPRLMERMESLRDRTDAASLTEVVKNAMKLYDALVQEAEAGSELFVRDRAGNERSYRALI